MSAIVSAAVAARLRALTPARVGLGRTGVSQQTRDLLDFQRAHAQARDAVHASLQAATLAAAIESETRCQTLRLRSAAVDRAVYLQRPDLGRTLSEESKLALIASAEAQPGSLDLAIVVADGLSALAVERHVLPLMVEWMPSLAGLRMGSVCVVEQGRVAIGDEIGEILDAEISVVLIGERPGLSSPDSLGAYITWQPRQGRTDAERNCISNIRGGGLSYSQAAAQFASCLAEARRRRLTGVELKMAASQLEEGGAS